MVPFNALIQTKKTGFVLLLLLLTVIGCEQKSATTLAFVGPTSGRNSDLGIEGRNGFILAIEHQNALKGINNQPINYILKDDQHDANKAVDIFNELYNNDKIAAVVGPMTSGVASSVLKVINSSDKITVSPTATSPSFSDMDDNFFRVLASTDTFSVQSANFLYQKKGIRTVSAVYDSANAAYSKSWLDKFESRFAELGGEVKPNIAFKSSDTVDVSSISKHLVSSSSDAIIIVTNSIDAALIIQQIRREQVNNQVILTAEWAGTERLLELAGQQAEGVYIPQFIDRMSQDQNYLNFKSAYIERFSAQPGFASITSYNATQILIKAIQQKRPEEKIKDVLLRVRNFGGIQTKVNFNDFGDNPGNNYMVKVENGNFVVQ